MTDPIRLGDPVIDQANGRAMVVLAKAADRADTWSERNDYDLLGNYGNERCGAEAADTVWTCAYVASLQSEPSKTYDFPASRLGRPAYERADDDGRVYDRVARDVLERLFAEAAHHNDEHKTVLEVATRAFDPDRVAEARELAAVDQQFGGGDDE